MLQAAPTTAHQSVNQSVNQSEEVVLCVCVFPRGAEKVGGALCLPSAAPVFSPVAPPPAPPLFLGAFGRAEGAPGAVFCIPYLLLA
jgi:hypothetical protein